ncbi:MAG: hypothetical protein ACOCWR_03375 [Oceanidesulfovibrio sp.]
MVCRLALFALLLAASAWLPGTVGAATDIGPSAFDGIAWGTTLANLERSMGPADSRQSGDIRFFRRLDKEYRPAGLQPVPTVYAFYQDALHGVYIQPQTQQAAESMLTSLRLEYGDGERWTRFGVSYVQWRLGRLTVTHKADSNTGKYRIAFIHLPPHVAVKDTEQFIESLNNPASGRGYW